jgi:hypothetical protein
MHDRAGTWSPGPIARGFSERIASEEGARPVRRLDIVRSRGPALRRRRPNHLHGCGRTRREGARERTLFSKYINIIPNSQDSEEFSLAQGWGGGVAARRSPAGRLPALRCAAVRAGDRRGDGRAKVQAADAHVRRFVERATGAANALDGRVAGAHGRSRCRRMCVSAPVLVGARTAALAQGVGESRSHGSTCKDSAHG